MDKHRHVSAKSINVIPFERPFSCFSYIDSFYPGDYPAIHRLFSLARSEGAHTLMVEEIDPIGMIADENYEIKSSASDYEMTKLDRINFWKSRFTKPSANVCNNKTCLGYAILKHDIVPSRKYDEWHIFEAVFKKYPHMHNCVPNPMEYSVLLGGEQVHIEGILYAQQNGLNKACSQVALRSLLSRITGKDISYKQINTLAKKQSSGFNSAKGLNVPQIRSILTAFKIQFRDYDYTLDDPTQRSRHPYIKYVYGGVESGMGALVGFRFSGPAIVNDVFHIIPFYGHTFNKDTWVPDAEMAYFRVGEKLGYIPSENWTSSFLGHDDNFGPNLCIPRLYIRPENVEYVVELLSPKIMFDGAQAEALALQFLYSVLNHIGKSKKAITDNIWLRRLAYYSNPDVQSIVLRAIAVDRETYIHHLSNEADWNQQREDKTTINILRTELPENFWVVEVSIPQLFPANQRKLGDIVINGEIEIDPAKKILAHFVLVRVPGLYFFIRSAKTADPDFLSVPSNLKSHLPVITLDTSKHNKVC